MPTTLLAVDDSVTMRKVLEMTFAGEDFRLVTADGVESGLTRLRSERPMLALVDVTLDGTTGGYTLCSKIKAESPQTAVVLLASKQQPYENQKGLTARADDFIEKPFDTQQLIDKVRRLLARPTPAAEPARPQPAAQPPAAQPAAAAQAAAAHPAPAAPISAAGRPGSSTVPLGSARPQGGPTPIPNTGAPLAAASPRPTASGIGAAGGGVGRGTLAFGGGFPGPAPQAPSVAGTPAAGVPAPGPRPVPAAAPPPAPPAAAVSPAAAAPPAAPPAAPAAAAPAAVAPPAPVAAVQAAPPPSPAPVAPAPAAQAIASHNGALATKLTGLGLSEVQISAVLALSREVVEKVVWEVVPVLAETIIKEELKRLTSE